MTWILRNTEVLALTVNALIFVSICCQRPFQPGKALYWAGAVILTVGVIKMKG